MKRVTFSRIGRTCSGTSNPGVPMTASSSPPTRSMSHPPDTVRLSLSTVLLWLERRRWTMSIDERTRHQLYPKLEVRLGPEDAAAMMELLPPVGWADVATKHDVEREFEHVRSEILSM